MVQMLIKITKNNINKQDLICYINQDVYMISLDICIGYSHMYYLFDIKKDNWMKTSDDCYNFLKLIHYIKV